METTSFAPPVDQLSPLVSEINASLRCYAAAQTSADRASALQTLASNSQLLKNASTNPLDAFSDFTLQPLANLCVRIAIKTGLFEALSTKEAQSIDELAKNTRAEVSLLVRIVRALVAFEILHENGSGTYSHTPFSRSYVDKSQNAWATWIWDEMIRSSTYIGSYFDSHALKDPTDAKNAPFSFAHGEQDTDIFEVVRKIGKLELLQDAMSGSSVLCGQEAVATYQFDLLAPGNDDIVLVDVGGNKGQTLLEIKRGYPEIKGKMIVQDLQPIIEGGGVSGLDASVEFQAYDFFKEVEPVKRAGAYLYQRIFHDWSDENCRIILKNLKPAMGPHSKLLISDVVVPDKNPNTRKVLRDMNMLLVGGMERSEKQWHALLESEGFVIEKIHGLHNSNNSIIEAVSSSKPLS